MIRGGVGRLQATTVLLVLLFVIVAGRDIARPFDGLHSWDAAIAAWSARTHLNYGLDYTQGFCTLAVGNPPAETPTHFLDHPQLPVILDAGAMSLFGVNEWALRLTALITTALSLPLLIGLFRRLFDETTGLLAALLYILFPVTGYFYAACWIFWLVPIVLVAWWCYLALLGCLNGIKRCDGRHLAGLGAALFLMVQLEWVGFFFAAAIGTDYVARCFLQRRMPELRLLLILFLCPVLSLVLDFVILLGGRGWDLQGLIGLYQFRSQVSGDSTRTVLEWFYTQWEFAQSNFTLPVLVVVLGYVLYVGATALARLRGSVAHKPEPSDVDRRFLSYAWLFFAPGLLNMLIFTELYWVHQFNYVHSSVFIALTAAIGIQRVLGVLRVRNRRLSEIAAFVMLATIVGFSAHGLNAYHGIRHRSPVEIGIFKDLGERIEPDKALLSYHSYLIKNTPYQAAHYRPEIAWYLDREIRAATTVDQVKSNATSGRFPYYLVPAGIPVARILMRDYSYEFFQGHPYQEGPPSVTGFPNHILFDLRYHAVFQRAYVATRAEQHEQAVDLYHQAFGLMPPNAEAAPGIWNNLGWSLAQLQQIEEAVAAYEMALRLKPDYPLARNNLEVARSYLPQDDSNQP